MEGSASGSIEEGTAKDCCRCHLCGLDEVFCEIFCERWLLRLCDAISGTRGGEGGSESLSTVHAFPKLTGEIVNLFSFSTTIFTLRNKSSINVSLSCPLQASSKIKTLSLTPVI